MSENDPAILVAKEWRVVNGDYMFEHIKVYEDVALKSGCCVVSLAREQEGGIENLLFIAKRPDLSEAELLSCMKIDPTQPMGAHSRWA